MLVALAGFLNVINSVRQEVIISSNHAELKKVEAMVKEINLSNSNDSSTGKLIIIPRWISQAKFKLLLDIIFLTV